VRSLAGTAGGAPTKACAASGLPTPAYIDAIANGVTVRAIDFQELRDRVQ
jgi:hypothetical protein